jgi:ribosomal protein S18 acetylase RimI-like enzyme
MALPDLTDLPPKVTLRDCVDEDRAFLYALYRETSAGIFARLGLPPEQLQGLLELQFRAREEGWRTQYPEGRFQIICFEKKPIGYFALGEREGNIALIYLGLTDYHRGRGIAAAITRRLQQAALQFCHAVVLHVEVGNPALAFWKHLNFRVLEELGPYISMTWNCPHPRDKDN